MNWDIYEVNQCLFVIVNISRLGPSGMCLYIDVYYCVISFTMYNGTVEVLCIWLQSMLHVERN
jgi:hypothetical protein